MRDVSLLPAALAVTLAWLAPASGQSQDAPVAGVGRIDGRTVTAYAELLSGATVTLASRTGSVQARTATSTAAGVFAFENVAPGEYVLTAAKPGYTDREVTDARLRTGREVTIADGEQAGDFELTLRRSGSIAGRILRPDGTPAPDTQVMVALRNGAQLRMLYELRTTSEWDGRYEIADVPPGDFLVVVLPPPGSSPPAASSLPVDVSPAPLQFAPTLYPGVPSSEPGGTVPVYEGVATEGIDVWLTPAPQRFAVSGRVFWPEGLAIDNLAIEFGGAPDVRSGVWYVEDPGGLFTLEGISQGTLVLLAHAESNRGPLVGLVATEVLLGPVEEVRLDLSPPGSVSGRIISTPTLPEGTSLQVTLTHTLLRVSALFAPEEAVATAEGHFQIPHARGAYLIEVRGLPPGWQVRQVSRNGTPLPGSRLFVGSGDRITGIEIHVAPDA